jgi:hypothetical protein
MFFFLGGYVCVSQCYVCMCVCVYVCIVSVSRLFDLFSCVIMFCDIIHITIDISS